MTDDKKQRQDAEFQEKEQLEARSTMARNLSGQNVDARGVVPGELENMVADVHTYAPYFKNILDQEQQAHGGVFERALEATGTMKYDPDQEISRPDPARPAVPEQR